MHIIIGLAAGVALLYFLRNWWVRRRKFKAVMRMHEMLYPQVNPAALRKYVKDVYGRADL